MWPTAPLALYTNVISGTQRPAKVCETRRCAKLPFQLRTPSCVPEIFESSAPLIISRLADDKGQPYMVTDQSRFESASDCERPNQPPFWQAMKVRG